MSVRVRVHGRHKQAGGPDGQPACNQAGATIHPSTPASLLPPQVVLSLRWVHGPDTLPEGSGCHDIQPLDAQRRHYHHLGMCGHELPDGERGVERSLMPHPVHAHTGLLAHMQAVGGAGCRQATVKCSAA